MTNSVNGNILKMRPYQPDRNQTCQNAASFLQLIITSFLMIPLHNLTLQVPLWTPGQSFLSLFSAWTACTQYLCKESGGLWWGYAIAEVWQYWNLNWPKYEHRNAPRTPKRILNLGLSNRRCFNQHNQFVIIPWMNTVQFPLASSITLTNANCKCYS